MMRRIALAAIAAAVAGCSQQSGAKENALVMPALDAGKGRDLFVNKGCVLCHAVNGVGGKAAPALDAADDFVKPDPLDFAARMWRGAPAMVEFQSVELGYVIDLSGEDIAHLAAFAANRAEQKKFLDSAIPGPMRDSLLDERFWEVEDWSEFMANGQEGYEPPKPESEGETPAQPPADPNATPPDP
jgi:mono/diheme cytochrome c family protein